MRSAKESGCFPYGNKRVCYIEVSDNGNVRQLSSRQEKFDAFCHAKAGIGKLLAVWPGQWRSDLFVIDDLDAFFEGERLCG